MNIYATTNQKQALMMEKGKERRFDRGGACGEHDSLVLGVIKLGYCKNLKRNDEFIKNKNLLKLA
jgi:hypothetical protein